MPEDKIPKIAILIIVSILAVSGIFGAYFGFKTGHRVQNNDTGWTTYSSMDLGFEISHPSSWYIWTKDNPVFLASAPQKDAIHGLGLPPPQNVWVNIKKGACENATDDFIPFDIPQISNISEKTLCVGDFQLTFGLYNSDPNFEGKKKLLGDVEKSFKTIADTSDWKTYRNEEYGFEIRYPKDWIMEPGLLGTPYPRFLFKAPDSSFILYEPLNNPPGTIRPYSNNDWEEETSFNGEPVRVSHILTTAGEEASRFILFLERGGGMLVETNYDVLEIECFERDEEQGYCMDLAIIGEVDQQSKQTLNQILSTFKFIK